MPLCFFIIWFIFSQKRNLESWYLWAMMLQMLTLSFCIFPYMQKNLIIGSSCPSICPSVLPQNDMSASFASTTYLSIPSFTTEPNLERWFCDPKPRCFNLIPKYHLPWLEVLLILSSQVHEFGSCLCLSTLLFINCLLLVKMLCCCYKNWFIQKVIFVGHILSLDYLIQWKHLREAIHISPPTLFPLDGTGGEDISTKQGRKRF